MPFAKQMASSAPNKKFSGAEDPSKAQQTWELRAKSLFKSALEGQAYVTQTGVGNWDVFGVGYSGEVVFWALGKLGRLRRLQIKKHLLTFDKCLFRMPL